jgi:hypothetical protein
VALSPHNEIDNGDTSKERNAGKQHIKEVHQLVYQYEIDTELTDSELLKIARFLRSIDSDISQKVNEYDTYSKSLRYVWPTRLPEDSDLAYKSVFTQN